MSTSPAPANGRLAKASLVLGIVSLPFSILGIGLLLAVPSVICGGIAWARIRKSAAGHQHSGNARIGFVTGCIAIVVSLVAILTLVFPTVRNLQLYVQGTAMLQRGKKIHVMAAYVDDPVHGLTNNWPGSRRFATSTDFFNSLLAANGAKVDLNVFELPGARPSPDATTARLAADRNAWCAVADLSDDTPERTPVLFTRNLRAATLSDLRGTIGDQLTDDRPFGRHGLVLIQKDGHCLWLTPDTQWEQVLPNTVPTNRILRP